MTKQRKRAVPQRADATPAFFARLTPLQQDLVCVAALFLLAIPSSSVESFSSNAAFATEGDTAAAFSYQHAGDRIAQRKASTCSGCPFFFSGMPTFGNVAYVPHNVSYLQNVRRPDLNLLLPERKMDLAGRLLLSGRGIHVPVDARAEVLPHPGAPRRAHLHARPLQYRSCQRRPWIQTDGAHLPAARLHADPSALRAAEHPQLRTPHRRHRHARC